MRRLLLPVLIVLVAGCSLEREPGVSAPTLPATSTTSTTLPGTTAASTTTAATTTTQPEDACPEGDVMLADGGLLEFERPTSDGTRIAGIDWGVAGGCHTVTIEFATADGAPATTPPGLDVELLRDAGVLRIDTGATASVVVDQLVEEGSVERLFVPVDEEGSRFVDLILSERAVGRAAVLTSPARLRVELQPGGPEVGRPLISSQVVIVEPGSAAVADPVLDVAGYTTGDVEELQVAALRNDTTVTEATLEFEPEPGSWTAFHEVLQVGEVYDTLRVTSPDGSVIAAIPLNQ